MGPQGQNKQPQAARFASATENLMNALLLAMTLLSIEHGICYAVPGEMGWLAYEYRDLGCTWVKFNPPGALWADVEARPGDEYDWTDLDKAVVGSAKAGLAPVIVIGPGAGWGSKPLKSWEQRDGVSSPVLAEYRAEYAEYVAAIVERYDGDGSDDPPGYRGGGARAWEVLTEAQHAGYWVGTAEEYVALLRLTHDAIKRADPKAIVILSGFWFADLFDGGNLSDAQIEAKLKQQAKAYNWMDRRYWEAGHFRQALAFNKRILQESNCYDAVEFHLLSGPESIPGTVDWIRRNMPKAKPVWIGDCVVSPPIPTSNVRGWWSWYWTTNTFAPPAYLDGDVRWRILTSGKAEGDLTYDEVRQWFLGEQVKHVSRVLQLARQEKITAIGWFTWLDDQNSPPGTLTCFERQWRTCGLRDPGPWYWPVGDRRPVYGMIRGAP